jgi:hypothetical protein
VVVPVISVFPLPACAFPPLALDAPPFGFAAVFALMLPVRLTLAHVSSERFLPFVFAPLAAMILGQCISRGDHKADQQDNNSSYSFHGSTPPGSQDLSAPEQGISICRAANNDSFK